MDSNIPKPRSAWDPLESLENIQETMTYHAPTEAQKLAYQKINEAAVQFAEALRTFVPSCADRSYALRSLRAARMWANAAIALEGKI
jgi:hypothetical protein